MWLRQAGDLTARAAMTLVGVPKGGAREATVALEQGRAFLLAEALDLRVVALDRLDTRAPQLAARFRAAAERVAVARAAAAGAASLSRPALRPTSVDVDAP